MFKSHKLLPIWNIYEGFKQIYVFFFHSYAQLRPMNEELFERNFYVDPYTVVEWRPTGQG